MRRFLLLALTLMPMLSMAQDDLYFTSSKKEKEAAQKRRQTTSVQVRPVTTAPPATVDYQSNRRSEDEYNRRYVYGGEYAGSYADDSLAARIETVEEGTSSRYDMDDPELDYRYSRRIVRFHNPRIYVMASPYYWDLYYTYGAWDYLYDTWDPWYWHYGWSYGWTWGPWDCWYGGIWGWHHPHAWAYWGWGPSWGHPVHYGRVHYRNTVPRQYNSARGHMAANNRLRTNSLGGSILNTRSNAIARSGITNTRSQAAAGRTMAVRSTRGTSYTDYTNRRTGRTSVSANEGARTQSYNSTRSGAVQRSTATRGNNGTTYQPTRSYSNQNSSSRTQPQTTQPRTPTTQQRTTTTQPRTSTYTPPTRSSSSGSFGGSRGGGSFGGGGSRGGGSFGGGGSRGGGGRR